MKTNQMSRILSWFTSSTVQKNLTTDRTIFVSGQDLVNHTGEGIKLGSKRWLRADIPWWHRKLQHLGNCSRINPKLLSRCATAQSIDLHRMPDTRV